MRMSGKLALCAVFMATASACGQETDDNHVTAAENAQPAANETMESDPNNPYAQIEMQMHDRMMAATGATPSETWIRKMIEHHQGAIDMANVLIAQGGDADTLAMARQTIQAQTREIQQLRAMLEDGGAESPGGADSAPETTASTPPPAGPRPAPKAQAPRPRPEPPAKKEEPEDPHAGHDMGNMANTSRD